MARFLEKLQISSFDDIVAALALYRPGAMDYIDNYIRRNRDYLKYYYDIYQFYRGMMAMAGAIASNMSLT